MKRYCHVILDENEYVFARPSKKSLTQAVQEWGEKGYRIVAVSPWPTGTVRVIMEREWEDRARERPGPKKTD